jgi:hypothetical protein
MDESDVDPPEGETGREIREVGRELRTKDPRSRSEKREQRAGSSLGLWG